MIVINNLGKDFDTGFSLKDINLVIETGEKIKIFGPNGAGKTTFKNFGLLVQAVPGVLHHFRVSPYGKDRDFKRIGLTAPSGHFYELLTVYQNLEFYGKMYGLSRQELGERIKGLLKQFNLSEKENTKVNQLSKGMKQRLAIIKALLHDPPILLLDEPFSGLDLDSANSLKNYLNSLTDKTIITATHDFDWEEGEKNRIIIFDNGAVVFDGVWSEGGHSFKAFYKKVVGK